MVGFVGCFGWVVKSFLFSFDLPATASRSLSLGEAFRAALPRRPREHGGCGGIEAVPGAQWLVCVCLVCLVCLDLCWFMLVYVGLCRFMFMLVYVGLFVICLVFFCFFQC